MRRRRLAFPGSGHFLVRGQAHLRHVADDPLDRHKAVLQPRVQLSVTADLRDDRRQIDEARPPRLAGGSGLEDLSAEKIQPTAFGLKDVPSPIDHHLHQGHQHADRRAAIGLHPGCALRHIAQRIRAVIADRDHAASGQHKGHGFHDRVGRIGPGQNVGGQELGPVLGINAGRGFDAAHFVTGGQIKAKLRLQRGFLLGRRVKNVGPDHLRIGRCGRDQPLGFGIGKVVLSHGAILFPALARPARWSGKGRSLRDMCPVRLSG